MQKPDFITFCHQTKDRIAGYVYEWRKQRGWGDNMAEDQYLAEDYLKFNQWTLSEPFYNKFDLWQELESVNKLCLFIWLDNRFLDTTQNRLVD